VELAFAPILGAAAKTAYPAILGSIARLTQSATHGVASTTAQTLAETGELPSTDDIIENGLEYAAIDLVMQGLTKAGHLSFDFGKAVSKIAKTEKVPKTEILKRLWNASKNYIKTKFNRSVTPENISPADVEVLLNEAKRLEQEIDITPKEVINEASEKVNPKSQVPIKRAEAKTNKKTKTPKSEVKPKKEPEPIIETTGEGAEKRLEDYPSTTEKLKKKANDVIEAAKNPKEVLHQIYTKGFDALEPINRLEKDIPVEERVTTRIKQAQSAASDINNLLTQGIFDNVSNTFASGSLQDVYNESGETWRRATKGLKPGQYSVREMDTYRTSKEALKRQKKGLKSGVDTRIAEGDVSRLKQKYGPIDQRLRKFQTQTLEHYGKDLLPKDVMDQWTAQSHASLYRVMDYGHDAVVKEGSLAPKKPWYKAKGSERKIIPPSESDIQNLSMLVTNSKKNDSVLQYKKLVEQRRLPGKIVKSKNKEVPDKMLEDLELDESELPLAETLYNQSRKDAFTPTTGPVSYTHLTLPTSP
jgi:hypothetical protein